MKHNSKQQYPCPICGDEVEHDEITYCMTGEYRYWCDNCDEYVEPEADLLPIGLCPYCVKPIFTSVTEHTDTCQSFKDHLKSFETWGEE